MKFSPLETGRHSHAVENKKRLLEMSDKNKDCNCRDQTHWSWSDVYLSSVLFFLFPISWEAGYSQELGERDLCSHALGCSNKKDYCPVSGVHSEACRQGLVSQIHGKVLAGVRQPLRQTERQREGRLGLLRGQLSYPSIRGGSYTPCTEGDHSSFLLLIQC